VYPPDSTEDADDADDVDDAAYAGGEAPAMPPMMMFMPTVPEGSTPVRPEEMPLARRKTSTCPQMALPTTRTSRLQIGRKDTGKGSLDEDGLSEIS
jgi:hypothetical protein